MGNLRADRCSRSAKYNAFVCMRVFLCATNYYNIAIILDKCIFITSNKFQLEWIIQFALDARSNDKIRRPYTLQHSRRCFPLAKISSLWLHSEFIRCRLLKYACFAFAFKSIDLYDGNAHVDENSLMEALYAMHDPNTLATAAPPSMQRTYQLGSS